MAQPGGHAAGPVATAARAELAAAGCAETTAGLAAIALAARVDSIATDTGSAAAAAVRELRAAMADAMKDSRIDDSLSVLRARTGERRLSVVR